MDGKSYEGDVRFDADNTLTIQPKKGAAVKVAPANLLQANFRIINQPKPAPKLVPGQLPPQWQAQDIGSAVLPGSVHYLGDTFVVKAAGADITGRHDSAYFIYQQFTGDGQIVAHIRDLSARHEHAKVGVMFRETMDPDSRMSTVFMSPRKTTAFCNRLNPNAEFSVAGRGQKTGDATGWLLLSRRGNIFSASLSQDGSHWESIGREEIPMGRAAFIGLCVSSHDANVLCDAMFDQITIGQPNENPQPAAAPVAPAGPAGYSRSVVLKTGSIIGNATMTGIVDQAMQFNDANGKRLSVPLSAIARLTFVPLTPAVLAKIPEHAAGVLKVNGDFVEGEFGGLDGYRIKLSSVLFGLQNLPIGGEAAALVLRDVEPTEAPFIVRTINGSLYLAETLKFDRDTLVVDDATLGANRVPISQLLEIKAGGGRFVWLPSLKPARIEPPPGLAQSSAWNSLGLVAGRPAALDATPCEHAIVTVAGATITYSLQSQYKLFLCQCGIPDTVLPTAAARLVILADGHEIYRGPPRTSLDEPVTLSLPVASIGTLSLRVETDAPFPIPAAWGNAELVK